MKLSNIIIILDHPEKSQNIGAVCRAMANNDIFELRIVGKKSDYDAEKVHVLAIHAAYIFDNAKFYKSIKLAASDCSICAGTTRRRGKKRMGKLFLPEEFAEQAGFHTDLDAKVAIVFGNERTGLTDKQLLQCNAGVTIPSSLEFGSLNLSHAVQIICYTLFRQQNSKITGYTPLTLNRLDETVKKIADNLQNIGFFSLNGRNDMENFWKNILSRAALSESEAQYLEKIFTKTTGLFKKNSK